MMKFLSALALTAALGASVLAQQKPPAFTPIPAPDNVAKPPADAAKTASGLASVVLQPGTGKARPAANDLVTVHYTGWTTDGKMFDSSFARNAPSSFPLDRVIKGWGEGVQLMVVGEKRRFWIPQEIAYNGMAGRPAGMLVFDIELLDLSPTPSTPPPDVAAPPADAKRTASGLAYKSLRAGQRRSATHAKQHRHGALHGLDDGREDVRHVGRQGSADQFRTRGRDCGVD